MQNMKPMTQNFKLFLNVTFKHASFYYWEIKTHFTKLNFICEG